MGCELIKEKYIISSKCGWSWKKLFILKINAYDRKKNAIRVIYYMSQQTIFLGSKNMKIKEKGDKKKIVSCLRNLMKDFKN